MNRSSSQCSNLGLGISQGRGLGGEASVKIGGLWKRSQGVSRFTKPNYKHRVFILTDQALSYYQGTIDRIGQLKGRVSLDTVRAVEFVQDGAFKLAHTFQVMYQSKKHGFITLYVTATDKNHCSEWVASLRQACYFNRDMLMHFHPGALVKNKWSCCNQRGKTTLGCQPTYHLLTRSSSRYAQMRRRDTLTSGNSQRRLKNGSGPYSTLDRQSLATCSQVSDHEEHLTAQGKSGRGLSNSCMNLTSTAPHRVESFAADDAQSSQRSSRVSTDHSVGVDSITLTRVSMLETTPTGFDGECEGQSTGLEVNELSLSQTRQTSSKGRSRSQVAPELETSLPVKHFPLPRTHPLEMEHKSFTLPNPKSKSRKHSQRYINAMEQANDDSITPCPVPPPRHRRHNHVTLDSALTGSVHVIPTDRTRDDHSGCHDDESNDNGNVESGKMKHSHTFVVQCRNQTVGGAIEQQQHLRPPAKSCSQSMNVLSKPLIAPKFSLTNPNIVHV